MRKQPVARVNSRKLAHALQRVANHPEFSEFSLRHDLNLNTLNTLRLEIKTSYESLHLLLDREILLRCQFDLLLENPTNFILNSDPLSKFHECEGLTHSATRTFQDIRFRTCNKLCRLKKEAREELLKVEDTLGDLHIKQKQQISSIEAMESRLNQELS
jgi:hypothetical protein